MSELLLTPDDKDKHFEVQVGTIIRIRLPENPSTGFRWEPGDDVNERITFKGSAFSRGPVDAVGAAGKRTLTFTANRPGQIKLRLKNWRMWEGESSVRDRFEVWLTIVA